MGGVASAVGGLAAGGLGGGGKGGGGVSAPDFNQIAREQAQLSQNAVDRQTLANRSDQTNAFGASTDWTRNADGSWTNRSSFGGPLGTAIGNLANQVGSQGAIGTGDQAREQAIGSAYTQAMSRLRPEWDRREQATRSRLAAQGLSPDSEAARNEIDAFGRARNDAESSAMANAIAQGTAAGNSVFQNNLAASMSPLQRLAAIQSLGQQDNVPMAGQAQTPDLMGAAQNTYQAQLNSQAQKNAGKNSMLSGLGGIAGSVFGGPLGGAIGSSLGGMLGG